MFDFSVMLLVKLPVVETTQTERNKFATGVENKVTGDLKTNNSPDFCLALSDHE